MRELFLKTLELTDATGATGSYDYYITVDQLETGRFACESYGLRVTRRESGESAAVPHITCSIPRIDELSELVLRGGVTPATLRDVVADWL